MSTIRYYYEDELRYLYRAGREFAKNHPDVARYLHIDTESKDDRDPHVERLFEGFAFLAGRIRERLDDELPQLTESLCDLLWPHFLRPIPAISILEFVPRPGLVQQTTLFPQGTEVRSIATGPESTVCRFRTTQDVRLQPMRIVETSLRWPSDGSTVATLRIVLDKGVAYEQLQLASLQLCFHAEDSIASTMHLFFSRHVRRVVLSSNGVEREMSGAQAIQPVGLGKNEGLLPYSDYSFRGFRVLQEYMSFRRKFWFIDVLGLDRFHPASKTTEFTVRFDFAKPFPEEKKFTTDNIRLHCTPIVNLFRADAEPVRVDHLLSEYRIIPDARHPGGSEVYSVETATSSEEGTGKQHTYGRFFSFQGENTGDRYFTTSTRVGPSNQYQTYISLLGGDESNVIPETLSMELTCTNGSLPRERLAERTITEQAPDFPNVATFHNLTTPTLDLRPKGFASLRTNKREENSLWRTISHLSLNFLSVASAEGLRHILELYDWTGTEANKRRIAGIRNVSWAPKETRERLMDIAVNNLKQFLLGEPKNVVNN